MGTFWTVSRMASYGLLAMVALFFVAAVFLDDSQIRLETGCYWFETAIFQVECRGFVGASVVQAILNLPLWLFVYGATFLYATFAEGQLLRIGSDGQLLLVPIDSPAEILEIVLLLVFPVVLILGLLYPLRWAFLKLRAWLATL